MIKTICKKEYNRAYRITGGGSDADLGKVNDGGANKRAIRL